MLDINFIINIAAPVVAVLALFCIDKFTQLRSINKIVKELLIGAILGGIGILVSEFVVPYHGVFLSARNLVIILSGLIFGWPAGLLTGTFVGVERLVSLSWAPDTMVVLATGVGALVVAVYTAILRKFLFKNARPGFLFTTVISVVAESVTLLLILLFNINNSAEALPYVREIFIPILAGPAVAAFATSLLVELIDFKQFKTQIHEKKEVAFKVQHIMLAVVSVLFIASVGAIYLIEDNKSNVETMATLKDGVETPKKDIEKRINVHVSNELYQYEMKGQTLIYYETEVEQHDRLLEQMQNSSFVPVTFAQIIDNEGNVKASAYCNDSYGDGCSLSIPNNFNYFTATESSDPTGFCKILKDYSNSVTLVNKEAAFTTELSKNFIESPFKLGEENFIGKFAVTAFDYNYNTEAESEKWYVLIGINEFDYADMYNNQANGLTENTRVGKSGVSLIYSAYRRAADEEYDFYSISAPEEYLGESHYLEQCPKDFKHVFENIESLLNQKDFEKFDFKLRDEDGFAMVDVDYDETFGEYKIYMAIVSQAEMFESRNNAIVINTLLQVIIFAVLFGVVYLSINLSIVKPLNHVKNSLGKITEGNLDEVVDVQNSKEFVQLSTDINKTVDTLKDFIEKEKNRMAQDLALAKSIQKNALPSVYPDDSRITIAASMNTAKEVGGDFYDFYVPKEDQVNIVIADVSGKGVPAAMFMMRAKTQLKSLSEKLIPISNVFNEANKELCNGNDAGMFVTTWQGNLNLKTGVMQLVNAGHNPPLIKHKNGKFEYLKTKAGFVLAGFDMFTYQSIDLKLEKGDQILLYTDGITEAHNINNELYGDDRLLDLLNGLKGTQLKPENVIQAVFEDVGKFSGEAPQFDDETMVCFIYNGK